MKFKNIIILIILFICLIFSFHFLYNKYTSCFNNECNKKRLPIIMYHHLLEDYNKCNDFTITPKQFENDLKYLKDNGYTTISIKQLLDYVYNGKNLPEKPIMITFDDGHESFYHYAYPLLQKYNMKAILSIVGEYTENYSKNEDHNIKYSYVTWNEVSEMAKSPFVEIGNHTYSLHSLKDRKGCNQKEGEDFNSYKKILTSDISNLQSEIEKYTGSPALSFAYPFGRYNKNTKEIVKQLDFPIIFNCAQVVNIIDRENPDFLQNLGRFNRPNGINSDDFFSKILD